MPDIKDSVGDGGTNNVHDVALVQAMLRVVKDAKNHAYLGSDYDGAYGKGTKGAIIAFQTDHKLGGPGGNNNEPLGRVNAGGATVQKLSAMLPASHADMRIIEGQKTVYLPGTDANLKAAVNTLGSDNKLEQSFRTKVVDGVKAAYAQYKLTLWAGPNGRHRTFADQFAIPAANTKVGPGESNHNFGRAADLVFKDFRWIRGDETIVTDSMWLAKLGKSSAAKAKALWDARDQVLTGAPGLFTLKVAWDRPHIQNYDNSKVHSRRSLAALLNTVGTMKWTAAPTEYKCDLGLGGAMIGVGTSKQIWGSHAAVTATEINKAVKSGTVLLAEARAKWNGTYVAGATLPPGSATATAADVIALQKALKREFSAADVNFAKWKPLP